MALRRRRPAGYTLTEMMLVVLITGILFAVAPSLLIQMTRFFRQNNARIEIQREAREALDAINRNLRQAQASTVVIDQATGEPPYSRIAFTRLKPGSGTNALVFYKSGKNLYMTVNGGGAKAISKNVRYLGFTYPRTDTDSIVSVSLTTEASTFEQKTKALHLSVEKVRIMNE